MNEEKREIEDTNSFIRILIIDDCPDDRALVIRKLKKEFPNLTTREVIDESSFSEAIQAGDFDAVITDYHLCWTNGIKILRALKARYPYCPVIMLTGTGNEIVAVEAMKAGLDDYVIKSAEHFVRVPASVRMSMEKRLNEQKLLLAEEALKQSERKLEIKNRIANILLTVSDDQMFGKVLEIVLEAMESKYGIFGYIDEDGSWVSPSLTADIWDKCQILDKDIRFPRETWGGIWGQAMAEKKTLYSNESFNVPEGHITILRALDVPIIQQGKLIGNFLVGDKETDYDEKDKQFLESLSDYIAPVLQARLQIGIKEKEKQHLEAQFWQAQKMEAIGTLTGGIAHDFNNILTTILGNAHMILTDSGNDNTLREGVEEIKKAGERATVLTRQLLAFSRKQKIHPQIMDLNEVLVDLEKMLGRLIGEDVEFKTILQPALWRVNMDPGHLEQILMNLVVNAKDAMPRGGKLLVETANVDLDEVYFSEHVVEAKPGPYVMLTISDTGIGMDEETQSRIFEPFFTTKTRESGTGLGLSTVYGIVKQAGGFIWVYSEPGKSSTFKIYLPGTEKDADSREKEQISVDEVRGSETVLIVEDDEELRNLGRKILKRLGYSVLEAENAERALKNIREYRQPIHLVVTDVVMPGMSGKDLAEQLATQHPHMKVLYMSGYTDNIITDHGILDSDVAFLEKPFTPKDLGRKVREMLDK